MAERYTKIFSLKNGICEKGLPIKINAGALLRDNVTGKLLVQLKIQNAQKKTLTLVRVKILQGREQAALDFEYKDLSVAENGEFGVQTPIFLTSEKAKTFSVTVTGVKFEDGTVWIPAKAPKQAPTGTIRQTKPTPAAVSVKKPINPSPSSAPAEAAAKTSPAPDENKIKENDLLYNSAIELAHSGNIDSIKKAVKQFEAVRGWKDADKYILACRKKIAELEEQARAASMARAKAEAKAKAEAEARAQAEAEAKAKAEAEVKAKAETETKADSENSETKPKKKRKKIIFGLLLLGIVLGIVAVIFATCNRTIDVTEISLNAKSISLYVGESVDLTVKVSPNDATDKSVTWKSSNPNIATVSNGKVTAVGAGSATITVTASNGKTATCTVTVPVKPTEVLLNANNLTLEKDGSYTFIATVLPDNATNKNVTWKSSNTDVVTVSEGKATAVGTGNATITVTTSNGKTATCTVIVTNSIDDFKYEKNTTGYTITGVKNENKTSYVIPDSVTSIGGSAFFGCSSLTSITILDSVTSIGDSAFSRCSGLTSITIGNSVTSIGKYAFYGCTGLTSITIPDSVTSIGRSAFVGCSGLTSITIPFVGATKNGTSNTHFGYIFGAELFSNNSKYVPLMLKTVIITGGTSIGDDAFWDCSGLTSITIGNNVTSVGKSAFSGCSGLTSITIPNSVTSIGRYAFYDCRGLTSITIPNSVTSIGNWAFSGCSGLTSINFQGTKAQWNKITLGSDWKYDSGITHIICTDGPIYV